MEKKSVTKKIPKIVLDKDGVELKCKFAYYATNGKSVYEVTKPSQTGKSTLSAYLNETDVDFSGELPVATKQVFKAEQSDSAILNNISEREKANKAKRASSSTSTTKKSTSSSSSAKPKKSKASQRAEFLASQFLK